MFPCLDARCLRLETSTERKCIEDQDPAKGESFGKMKEKRDEFISSEKATVIDDATIQEAIEI